MIFTKIDKKVLIILVVVLIAVLLAGFGIYKYMKESVTKNSVEVKQSPQTVTATQNPQVQVKVGGVGAQGTNGGGTLSVCMDKCGDGICQKIDPTCTGNNLNCICQETSKDCPKDCK